MEFSMELVIQVKEKSIIYLLPKASVNQAKKKKHRQRSMGREWKWNWVRNCIILSQICYIADIFASEITRKPLALMSAIFIWQARMYGFVSNPKSSPTTKLGRMVQRSRHIVLVLILPWWLHHQLLACALLCRYTFLSHSVVRWLLELKIIYMIYKPTGKLYSCTLVWSLPKSVCHRIYRKGDEVIYVIHVV